MGLMSLLVLLRRSSILFSNCAVQQMNIKNYQQQSTDKRHRNTMSSKFDSGLRINVCLFPTLVTSELCSKQIKKQLYIFFEHLPKKILKQQNYGLIRVADPDFELRRGPGSILLAQSVFFLRPFLLFSPKIRGALTSRVPPLDPPLDKK